jgi:hypothetical protein
MGTPSSPAGKNSIGRTNGSIEKMKNSAADCGLDKPGEHTPVEITMELKARGIELLLQRLMAQVPKGSPRAQRR